MNRKVAWKETLKELKEGATICTSVFGPFMVLKDGTSKDLKMGSFKALLRRKLIKNIRDPESTWGEYVYNDSSDKDISDS